MWESAEKKMATDPSKEEIRPYIDYIHHVQIKRFSFHKISKNPWHDIYNRNFKKKHTKIELTILNGVLDLP